MFRKLNRFIRFVKIALVITGAGTLAFINYADRFVTISIPVKYARSSDWDPHSFWYYPWGESVVHKGIDIFMPINSSVISATNGIVLKSSYSTHGGNYIYLLGPNLRVYYYAHLNKRLVKSFWKVKEGQLIGLVGDTGNAIDAPFHLHFSIFSIVPVFKYYNATSKMGWKRLFYMNPTLYFKND